MIFILRSSIRMHCSPLADGDAIKGLDKLLFEPINRGSIALAVFDDNFAVLFVFEVGLIETHLNAVNDNIESRLELQERDFASFF